MQAFFSTLNGTMWLEWMYGAKIFLYPRPGRGLPDLLQMGA